MGKSKIYKTGSIDVNWREHRLKSVQVLDGYKLYLVFREGTEKTFDVTKVFGTHPMYDALKDCNLFLKVHLSGTSGIAWNDDIDIGAEQLWAEGQTAKTLFDNLIGMSDATKAWGLQESTIRQAIRRGTFIIGEDVMKFGNQWILSKGAVEREYGKPIKERIEWYESQLDELSGDLKKEAEVQISKLKSLLK